MDTADVLKKAWQAVEGSGVPESLYEVAFQAAVAHLTASTPRPNPAPAPPPAPDAAAARGGADSTDSGGSVDPDAVYARLAAESGVDEAAVREVILIESDGEVAILKPGRALGSSNAAKARTVASLVAGAYFGGFNRRSLPIATIRDACDDRGCYDHKNFKTFHIGNHDALSVRNNDVHINLSKWAESFEAAVNQARGVAG